MHKVVRNYYLMMSPFVIGYLFQAWQTHSIRILYMFVVFAAAGVLGETLVNIWWRMFFQKPLWVYKVEIVLHGFTSWLNFIPWALGGSLYMSMASWIQTPEISRQDYFIFVGSIFLQIILFQLFKTSKNFRFNQIRPFNLIIFYFPIFLFIIFLAEKHGSQIYTLALLFASIPTLAEYLFGKITERFISKKLWDYTYLSFDRGHFTPLSIPLFCLGGFYFLFISKFI